MEDTQNQVVKSYKEFWTRFLDVKGRSRRADYWHQFWINFVISSLLGIVSAGFLSSLFALAIIIPTFTVMVRRLHDTNRTMALAIVSYISGFIATFAAVMFVFAIVAAASASGSGVIGLTLIAGAFGTVVAGLVALYTLIVLIIPGDNTPNNYGDGGSCLKHTQGNFYNQRPQSESYAQNSTGTTATNNSVQIDENTMTQNENNKSQY
ncbi:MULTISPECIES: DUF805 domain-containing protein [Staphylococcus]|uniref:DUF805 domain-containing protein n=1 Tax=Staphylococcus hsinchuensis TaxID=3051183 RepID=A0ABZ3EE87_9STAP|nr:DUF805 domain-containing protein [Staphylococcus sp. Marseille-Q6910]